MQVRFGMPAHIAVPGELARLGAKRAVVLSTASQQQAARDFAAAVGAVEVVAGAMMHTPVEVTVTSGLNAVAHAVEALYARDRTPLTSAFALGGGAPCGPDCRR